MSRRKISEFAIIYLTNQHWTWSWSLEVVFSIKLIFQFILKSHFEKKYKLF
jgi:hypothetical protein